MVLESLVLFIDNSRSCCCLCNFENQKDDLNDNRNYRECGAGEINNCCSACSEAEQYDIFKPDYFITRLTWTVIQNYVEIFISIVAMFFWHWSLPWYINMVLLIIRGTFFLSLIHYISEIWQNFVPLP